MALGLGPEKRAPKGTRDPGLEHVVETPEQNRLIRARIAVNRHHEAALADKGETRGLIEPAARNMEVVVIGTLHALKQIEIELISCHGAGNLRRSRLDRAP